MKKLTLLFLISGAFSVNAQLNMNAQDWNIPFIDANTEADQIYNTNHGLYDMNGDGLPDLVDAEDFSTGEVWLNGTIRYWKVYLNNGNGFDQTAQDWNIPFIDANTEADQVNNTNHGLIDMNGDGLPDLVGAEDFSTGEVWLNGTIRYWKVYLNTGSGFNQTAQDWNIPFIDANTVADRIYNTNHGLYDINGDGLPDLIDAEDFGTGQVWLNGTIRYWKVYLNNGSGFDQTAQDWNIPFIDANTEADQVNNTNHGLVDMNGDGLLDLVDAEDFGTGQVWLNGTIRYWKVYLNTGSGFNQTAQDWNIPFIDANTEADQIYNTNHGLYDINGDGLPDLVDAEDYSTGQVWLNGTIRYWKVYLNTGSGFNQTAQDWNIPFIDANTECDQVNNTNHGLIDMNGDGFLDLVDTEDFSTGQVWLNGTIRYWKVYLNDDPQISVPEIDALTLQVYPNPTVSTLTFGDAVKGEYTIIDLAGKIVASDFVASNQLDVSSLRSGTYLLEIQSEGQLLRARFVKQDQ